MWLMNGFLVTFFGIWRGQCIYTVIPVQPPYKALTCRVVGAFPCRYCAAPAVLPYSSRVAPLQSGEGITMWVTYSCQVVTVQLLCDSYTGWWGHYSSCVTPLQGGGAFLCGSHTSHRSETVQHVTFCCLNIHLRYSSTKNW